MAQNNTNSTATWLFNGALYGDSGVGKREILRRLDNAGTMASQLIGDLCLSAIRLRGRLPESFTSQDDYEFCFTAKYASNLLMLHLYDPNIVYLVYDVTRRTTFDKLCELKTDILRSFLNPEVTPVSWMVIGNKIDLGDKREVAIHKGEELAKELGAGFMEVSAHHGTNVYEAMIHYPIEQFASTWITWQKCKQAFSDKTLTLTRVVARRQLALVGPFGAGKSNLGMNFIRPGFQEEMDSTAGVTLLHTTAVVGGFEPKRDHKTEFGPLLQSVTDSMITTKAVVEAAASKRPAENTTALPRERTHNEDKEPHVSASTHPPSPSPASRLQKLLLFENWHKATNKVLAEAVHMFNDPQETKIFLDMLDCGGQLSFSILQALCFNAEQTIFLLVYNSSISLSTRLTEVYRKNHQHVPSLSIELCHGDYLDLWLSTLALIAAPKSEQNKLCSQPLVLVVGTHSAQCSADQVQESDADIHRLLKSYQNAPMQIYGPYHVDNSQPTDDDMKTLRSTLNELIQETAVFKETPLLYLKVEWLIKVLVKTKSLPPFLTLSRFSEFIQDEWCISGEGVSALLDYLHKNCTVRSFHHRSTSCAKAHVFLNTDWFLGQITKIISCSMMEVDATVPVSCRSDIIDCLKGKGILTSRLCEHLWSDLLPDVRHSLIQIMEEFGMQCPAAKESRYGISEDAGQLFHVPACIQRTTPALAPLPFGSPTLPDILFQVTGRYCPYAVYTRLVVLLLQLYKAHQPEIDFSRVRFCCDSTCHCYFAEVTHSPRGVVVRLTCTDARVVRGAGRGLPTIAMIATQLLSSVDSMLQRLRIESFPSLDWYLAFRCGEHEVSNSASSPWVITSGVEFSNFERNAAFTTSLLGSFLAESCPSKHYVSAPVNFHCWLTPQAVFQSFEEIIEVGACKKPRLVNREVAKNITFVSSSTPAADKTSSGPTASSTATTAAALGTLMKTGRGKKLKPGVLFRKISRQFSDINDVCDLADALLDGIEPSGGRAWVIAKKADGGVLDPKVKARDLLDYWCKKSSEVYGGKLYKELLDILPNVARDFRDSLLVEESCVPEPAQQVQS